jgi:hypothetical protein
MDTVDTVDSLYFLKFILPKVFFLRSSEKKKLSTLSTVSILSMIFPGYYSRYS